MVAPTQAEICLKLVNEEKKMGRAFGSIAWLASGIDIEQSQ
jgi:hypothetical protein